MDSFISEEDVRSVLTYDTLIREMETCLQKWSSRRIVQPDRTTLNVTNEGGHFWLMPSLCEDEGVLGTKLLTAFPNNQTKYGVSNHHSLIVLFEPTTGVPRAIVDGDDITSMRTAAVSAVATQYLAAPGSKKLAILGAGSQARSHFHALSSILDLEQVTVWSRTFENAQKLANDIGAIACRTAEEAVKDADVITVAIRSPTPVLQASWVKPGAHINAIGACRPDIQEIDPELMRSGVLYVDSIQGAMAESGDIILSKAEIYCELGEVIQGKKEAKKDHLTIFKSLGMGIEDAMAAQLVINLLKERDEKT